MNVIDVARKLVSMLDQLGKSTAVDHLPSARKSEIESIVDRIRTGVTQLEDFDRDFLDLKKSTEETKSFAQNLQYWDSIAPGIIKGDSNSFTELKENSITISDLYQAAIDIEQIIKFSPQELQFATTLGDSFVKFHDVWQQFKIQLQKKQDRLLTTGATVPESIAFFQLLRRFSFVNEWTVSIYLWGKKKWVEADMARLRQLNDKNSKIRFDFVLANTSQGFITGNWFNAYAYEVLRDQLKRLQAAFEIYTLVNYRSADRLSVTKGEIDVLARINDQIVVVECKSGKILSERGQNGFEICARKFEEVRQIFANAGISKVTFLLVFNPFLVEPAQVDKHFHNSDAIACSIDTLRGKTRELVQSLATRKA
jgi:hypothetical protein